MDKFLLYFGVLIISCCGPFDLRATEIKDVQRTPDGELFAGRMTIRRLVPDRTGVTQRSVSVMMQDVILGVIHVNLDPNATNSAMEMYEVTFEPAGAHSYKELWAVPDCAGPVRLANIRITGIVTRSADKNTSRTLDGQRNSTAPETAIEGLIADLNQRPIKGPGFGVGSVAIINQDGQIETVVGNPGDCVYVDGTAGPCGSVDSMFVDSEVPSGILDGQNRLFTLLNTPSGLSLQLFRNGLYMKADFDYVLIGNTVQFVDGAIPQASDTLVASYRTDISDRGVVQLQSAQLKQIGKPR